MDSNLLTTIIGLIGSFGFGLLFHKLATKKKRIEWNIYTSCLLSSEMKKIKGVDITYNSIPIDNLYHSKLQIRNSGNTIIEKQDIALKRPLCVYTTGNFIVDDQMQLSDLYDENNVNIRVETLKKGGEKAIIDFDFISKGQTIELSFFHTGIISFAGMLKEGKVVGNSDSLNANVTLPTFKKTVYSVLFASVFMAVIVTATQFYVYQKQNEMLLDNLKHEIVSLKLEVENSAAEAEFTKKEIEHISEFISEDISEAILDLSSKEHITY